MRPVFISNFLSYGIVSRYDKIACILNHFPLFFFSCFNACCGIHFALYVRVFLFIQTEQHFSDVVLSEEYLNLGVEQVCSLISSDKLTIASEEKVRTSVSQYWVYSFEWESELVLTALVPLFGCVVSSVKWSMYSALV